MAGVLAMFMDDQGWIGYPKREGVTSADLVREFYAALLDVVDIDAQVWSITIHGRPIGAFPTMEMENKPFAKDVFQTLMGWDMMPKKHTTKCTVERGELMLYVARGGIVDLPLYISMSLRVEAEISGTTALPYSLLLTQFLHGVGCMDSSKNRRRLLVLSVRLL
ncbi:hypothetical protein CJ030_MR0G005502 [Morella rubra]|uniref:Uncharacterized protein n=1 Tax=Morella rubra TaxID=262757 RepID=A0A6A1UL90_9ROSI|nr:hypothetical protein CJ030_MR0G005502 [Morella rubra]